MSKSNICPTVWTCPTTSTVLLMSNFACTLQQFFSNSLIVHKQKTREITTVMVVWILDRNYHKILQTFALNFSKNYEWFEKPYQKRERVFHQVSKHLEVS